ncbi:hypothetical protein GCM10009551_074880 [Nocardiopsis tropica]
MGSARIRKKGSVVDGLRESPRALRETDRGWLEALTREEAEIREDTSAVIPTQACEKPLAHAADVNEVVEEILRDLPEDR